MRCRPQAGAEGRQQQTPWTTGWRGPPAARRRRRAASGVRRHWHAPALHWLAACPGRHQTTRQPRPAVDLAVTPACGEHLHAGMDVSAAGGACTDWHCHWNHRHYVALRQGLRLPTPILRCQVSSHACEQYSEAYCALHPCCQCWDRKQVIDECLGLQAGNEASVTITGRQPGRNAPKVLLLFGSLIACGR